MLLLFHLPVTTGYRLLNTLTIKDTELLFKNLHLKKFQTIILENKIDGEKLLNCNSVEDIKQLLPINISQAKLLLRYIKEFRVNGIPPRFCMNDIYKLFFY